MLCKICNAAMSLLGMIDRRTKKDQWYCPKCKKLYLGSNIRYWINLGKENEK